MIFNTIRPLSQLPQKTTGLNNRNTNNVSFFFRIPQNFFASLSVNMRERIETAAAPQPYFVLSAGCGVGKEPVSIVITWMRMLETSFNDSEVLPLVVIALDAVEDNLKTLNSGVFEIGDWDARRLKINARFLKRFEPEKFIAEVKPEVLEPIHTTQMDLTVSSDVRGLRDFTPEGLGFHAIFCNCVTMYMDGQKSQSENRVIGDLGSLLRTDAASKFFFHHNEYSGGHD